MLFGNPETSGNPDVSAAVKIMGTNDQDSTAQFLYQTWRLLLRLDAPGAPALFVPASSIGTTM